MITKPPIADSAFFESAMRAAVRITLSPHEWTWTQSEQENMAYSLLQLSHEHDKYIPIQEERVSQDRKWGVQNHPDLYWLAILMEEVGEVSKAIIEHQPSEDIRKELVQVAAVAVAWLECMKRRATTHAT